GAASLLDGRTVFLFDALMTEEPMLATEAQLPNPISHGEANDSGDLPRALNWNQRRKSAYPLPGGYDGYVTSLTTIQDWVAERQPERETLERWLVEHLRVSATRSQFIIDFLQALSLLQANGAIVVLTDHAMRWRNYPDFSYLMALLHSRVQFIGEMIAV